MPDKITKESVMKELYSIICEKSRTRNRYYLYGRQRPITATKFYAFVYREIDDLIEGLLENCDGVSEYIAYFDSPYQLAEALVADFEHEYIERQLAMINNE